MVNSHPRRGEIGNKSGRGYFLGRACADCVQKKLFLLDLNGLLAVIFPYVPYGYTPHGRVSGRVVSKASMFYLSFILTLFFTDSVFKSPLCDIFWHFV